MEKPTLCLSRGSTASAATSGLFPPPALHRRRPRRAATKPLGETPSRRPSPAEEAARVALLRAKSPVCLTPGEAAMLEAFDLAAAYSGELAHVLAGIRAGLHVTRNGWSR